MKKVLWPIVPLLAIIAVRAADQPALKEGYWSIHTVSTNQPGNQKTEGNQTICRSYEYDQHAREAAKKNAAKTCKTISETTSGSTTITESECTMAGSVLHSKATVTAAGDTAVHSEIHTTNTPAMYGVSESTMIMDQKYIGACPAGVEPGDILGADGKKMSSWKH